MKLLFGKLKAFLLSSNIYREIQAVSFHYARVALLLVMAVKNRFLKVSKIENWCLAQQLKL